jgi:glycosyltransferase involved in cell wall biosynthesis
MIFLAGSLNMNGGSTFLLRMAREFHSRSRYVDVVVLSDVIDVDVKEELERYARVILLEELVHPMCSWVGTNQAGIFLPIRRGMVKELLDRHESVVHVMGIFGLVLALRWNQIFGGVRVSAGVYHQNEYLFKSARFFSRQAKKMFAALPGQNIVFFNEHTRGTYSKFFGRNYHDAAVLPIGISMPKPASLSKSGHRAGTLVSVGNLVNFKTYNEHIIRVVAELMHNRPELRYEIYGDGANYERLHDLVVKLDAQSVVSFMGQIPYAQFPSAVAGSMAFIGSGTALIEAAALGVPSIVGIESMCEPKTYGYISDVAGLTYNEKMDGVPLVEFRALILRLLDSDDAEIAGIANKCRLKAAEFSIDKTVDGFTELYTRARPVNFTGGCWYWIALTIGFVKLALLDRLGIDKGLRDRRNESTPSA